MKHADNADLIAGLNEDLAHEYASVIQYRTFASTVRGPHRMTLRPLFAGEVTDEIAHAGLLADAIAALGGTPTVEAARVAVSKDPAEMLHDLLEAERAALTRYVERRRQAEEAGEPGLAIALDSVIADETRHRDELRLVLAGWADAAAADERVAEGSPRRQPTRSAATRPGDRGPVDVAAGARAGSRAGARAGSRAGARAGSRAASSHPAGA